MGLGPEAPRVVYLAIMCGEVSVSVMEASTNTLLDHSSDCAAYVGKAKSGDFAYLIVLLPEWTAVFERDAAGLDVSHYACMQRAAGMLLAQTLNSLTDATPQSAVHFVCYY